MPLQPFIAAFAATGVEFFETVVIAYAIIRLGHWREATAAVVAGHAAMAAVAVLIYRWQFVLPLHWLRLPAALLLLATGIYWTAKSWRRLRAHRRPGWVDDPLGKVGLQPTLLHAGFSLLVFLLMLKTSLIEAAEILVFVLPIAVAADAAMPAVAGCAAAIAAVTLLALLAHGQLRRVPEVKFKFGAGLLLALMGAFWLWEALAPARTA